MVKPIKKERVEDLKELVKGAKSIVLNDFTGLNVADISELRRVCRENDIKFLVVKNTLAKRGFNDLGITELDPLLEGPTAIAVSDEDEAAPAQLLKKFAAEYELPRFKGAYVAGRVFTEKETERLASLPPRDILIAQTVSTFQAPLRGLVQVLNASLRDLVFVLKAIEDKKGAA
ncbi:MAG: 50S ribosomal protein L10 [Candidatus Krumholzibacteriota bacterium]|nr:50S ribosomal protein L10 [Candidatus Krumholzibacteriota bacterium]